jgi:hypothetical protein
MIRAGTDSDEDLNLEGYLSALAPASSSKQVDKGKAKAVDLNEESTPVR